MAAADHAQAEVKTHTPPFDKLCDNHYNAAGLNTETFWINER